MASDGSSGQLSYRPLEMILAFALREMKSHGRNGMKQSLDLPELVKAHSGCSAENK